MDIKTCPEIYHVYLSGAKSRASCYNIKGFKSKLSVKHFIQVNNITGDANDNDIEAIYLVRELFIYENISNICLHFDTDKRGYSYCRLGS